jgi:hypothetical protein
VSVRQGYAELASVLVSSDGVFIFEFTDSSFPFGKAPITIFSTQANSLIALVGPTLELSVDEATIRTPSGCSLLGDSNDDCRINAVDFFLVRWRYHRELFLERFDFSKDGKVDLIDFSIMAFNWTG